MKVEWLRSTLTRFCIRLDRLEQEGGSSDENEKRHMVYFNGEDRWREIGERKTVGPRFHHFR